MPQKQKKGLNNKLLINDKIIQSAFEAVELTDFQPLPPGVLAAAAETTHEAHKATRTPSLPSRKLNLSDATSLNQSQEDINEKDSSLFDSHVFLILVTLG
jgi:hypothetical protein